MQETSRSFHSYSVVASTMEEGKWFKEEETSSVCHFCFTQCLSLWKPEPGFLVEGWSLSVAAENALLLCSQQMHSYICGSFWSAQFEQASALCRLLRDGLQWFADDCLHWADF